MDLTFAALQQLSFSGFMVADVVLAEAKEPVPYLYLWSWAGLEENLGAPAWRTGTWPLGGCRWDAVPPHYNVVLWQELLENT